MAEITKGIIPSLSKIMPSLKSKRIPLHIAINTGAVKSWAADNKKDLQEAIDKHIAGLNELIELQLKHQNRVLTIALDDYEPEVLAALKTYFSTLAEDDRIHKNQIRLFVIGQWYNLDSELADVFKEMMERTKQYDNLFLNFCVRYDGQEELLGAIRLMVRKIAAEKLKEEDLSPEVIKENIYSSYFPPPELIIEPCCSYSGLLLWDAKGATIYYANKDWMLFDKKDFEDALAFYTKIRCIDN